MPTTLLVHEWIEKHGGAEQVLRDLTQCVGAEDLLVLWSETGPRFESMNVRESWLGKTFLRGKKALALPAMPLYWRNVDIGAYEKVVVSSHAFSHHVGSAAQRSATDVFAYVHTPARYVWAPELDPRGMQPLARIVSPGLRVVDRRRAQEAISYAANSRYIAGRIEQAWGRDARVIYPPVDVEAIQASRDWADGLGGEEAKLLDSLPGSFILGASRLVAYKRLDLAIRVGEELDLPVVIAGAGPQLGELQVQAAASRVPVQLLGPVSTSLLRALYARAMLYVFPGVEDFGIMPVEAIASGTPVLVNRSGGAAETVTMTGGGAIADPEDVTEFVRSARRAIDMDMSSPRAQSREFSRANFRARIAEWIGG